MSSQLLTISCLRPFQKEVRYGFLLASSQLNEGSQDFAKENQMPKHKAANFKTGGNYISYLEELRGGME